MESISLLVFLVFFVFWYFGLFGTLNLAIWKSANLPMLPCEMGHARRRERGRGRRAGPDRFGWRILCLLACLLARFLFSLFLSSKKKKGKKEKERKKKDARAAVPLARKG